MLVRAVVDGMHKIKGGIKLYKVDYYTLAICKDKSIGNIKQFSDIWYTMKPIEILEEELNKVLELKHTRRYVSVITNIKKIQGHCDIQIKREGII